MRKRPNNIHQVYNAGKVTLYETQPRLNEYGSPIRGEEELVPKVSYWFRELGLTASDVYHAHADDTDLTRKLAVRGNILVDVKWKAQATNKLYEIYRAYYNPKQNETELNLVEVASEY